MEEYRYDTQLLIEGTGLDEDAINDYFLEHFKGDCLLTVGDEDLIKSPCDTIAPQTMKAVRAWGFICISIGCPVRGEMLAFV